MLKELKELCNLDLDLENLKREIKKISAKYKVDEKDLIDIFFDYLLLKWILESIYMLA